MTGFHSPIHEDLLSRGHVRTHDKLETLYLLHKRHMNHTLPQELCGVELEVGKGARTPPI